VKLQSILTLCAFIPCSHYN